MPVQSRLASARRRIRPASLPLEEAVTHAELDQRGSGRLLALVLLLVTVVATADIVVGESVVLIGLFAFAPLLAATRLGPRPVAAVGLYALVLALVVGIPKRDLRHERSRRPQPGRGRGRGGGRRRRAPAVAAGPSGSAGSGPSPAPCAAARRSSPRS